MKPGFRCAGCPPGYSGNAPAGVGMSDAGKEEQYCVDVNECERDDLNLCDPNSQCINTPVCVVICVSLLFVGTMVRVHNSIFLYIDGVTESACTTLTSYLVIDRQSNTHLIVFLLRHFELMRKDIYNSNMETRTDAWSAECLSGPLKPLKPCTI